jgi:polyphosphate kinase
VTCPIFDKILKNELKEIFSILWNDNVKARKLDASLSNTFVKPGNEEYRSQVEVYNYLRKIHEKKSDN